MTDHLVRRYGCLPVPRYTSYPTAAEFGTAVGAQEHQAWLRRLDPRDGVSVYLHVPYCRQLCLYCGCHTKAVLRDEVIDRYRAGLEAEIALVARSVEEPLRIARIHWGGGTPSLLGAEGLDRVIDALSRVSVFQAGFEHAIELDPRSVDRALAQGLAALGINRVSLGVQDLDDTVQIAIGRVQPFEVVRNAVEVLRESGIGRINLDLMYGLPHQSIGSIRETCAQVLSLGPDRVACYGYAHMPQRKANQRLIDAAALPGTEERFRQAQAIAEAFTGSGYVAIGLDHFARPDDPLARASRSGTLRRNFQGYTDDDRPNLVGFGASAISQLPDGYVQNATDIGAYLRCVEKGRLATARGYRLTLDDRARGAIIESLMCNFTADLSVLGDPSHYVDELALLRPLVADGIVTVQDHRIAITEAGRPFVRLAAAVFDQFRAEDASRFSAAV